MLLSISEKLFHIHFTLQQTFMLSFYILVSLYEYIKHVLQLKILR